MSSESLGPYRKLDAFIYDATVLEYLVGQDSECVLLTVGSWFAMTGYGVGFPRHSKFRDLVNQQLMEYRENGKSFTTFVEIGCGVLKRKHADRYMKG
jgi:ABC-type amino acid transport substrate-binding protein